MAEDSDTGHWNDRHVHRLQSVVLASARQVVEAAIQRFSIPISVTLQSPGTG
ncbi:MAG: hypothetical protein RIE06_30055 [Roseibium album]|uniref:hypothetical protein n=1 Tax=Roseibium album TaxID=311410 RepID=UPI00131EE30D|nr:hypothetical protein [Roseibium album]MBG6166637.1 hypothetical protein [Labrenzia sp. EL_195]MBG6202835.1 hypothetical protein [Labrenzia sp. EL_13]